MSFVLLIVSLLLLADLVVLFAAARAPRGYEDQDGFHTTDPEPAPSRLEPRRSRLSR